MGLLAQPANINGLRLRNRTVMLPMVTNLSTRDGHVTEALVAHYAERARRDVGLVIVEATAVCADYKNCVRGLGIWDDALISGLARLAEGIKAGGAAAAIQLFHAGAKTYGDEQPPVGASGVRLRAGMRPRPLAPWELADVVRAFAGAARRAQAAGFDAIEIHAGHFYLLSEFLSPFTNHRDDAYGGDLAGRLRLTLEVVEAIRREVGPAYPIFLRMHGRERVEGGLSEEEAVAAARRLAAAGVDCFDVSMLNTATLVAHESGPYYALRPYLAKEEPAGAAADQAAAIRRATGLPAIAVGKLGDPEAAERVLAAGKASLIGVARNFLADPALATKMLAGRGADIVRCKECFACLTSTVVKQKPIRCAVNKQVGHYAGA